MAPLILDGNDLPAGGAKPRREDLIADATGASFAKDVIEASKTVPVIVDLWAPWCGPCKQLGPMLEKLVVEAAGLVRMVKVNVDENQQLAQQLRVQSIPAVFAFKDGRPVDGFAGALPESQLRAFIKRLTGDAKSPTDQVLEEARALLAAGAFREALEVFGALLAQAPDNPAAAGGALKACIALGELERARRFLDDLPPAMRTQSEVASAAAALELAEQGGSAAELQVLTDRLAKDPGDLQARYDLGVALYGAGRPEEAIRELVELVRRNRTWNEDAARRQLVKVFEALGHAHPLTVVGRRQLSSVLFS
ncbi:MAG: thioredoxin [Magnetospirillum sp. WYHS-4]